MTGLTGNILITGGTGTLGTAIATIAARERWDCRITIYSRNELRQAQLRARFPAVRCVLGDVADYDRLHAAMAGHDVVIHAAASKRIPECEQQPAQCIASNVIGALNVARAVQAHQVPLALGISTDKACQATTTYGASKLLLESIWRAQPEGGLRFVAVRYGNVVASNGSVIPIWRQQYANRQPLALTHPDMTRFWMAPSNAVALLVKAASEPHGTVLVPKMGALSLRAMAQIVCPGAETVVIGLRSAEKLHEDLIHPDETALETRTHFHIGRGTTGHRYASNTAPTLVADEFLAMLEEAERYG